MNTQIEEIHRRIRVFGFIFGTSVVFVDKTEDKTENSDSPVNLLNLSVHESSQRLPVIKTHISPRGLALRVAAHQRAVHLEQSLQRERVCGSGAAARVAQTTSPASRAV